MATVSFKFDEALFAKLSELAEQRTGLSPNTLAREIVTAYLEDAERERLKKEIHELKTQIRQLHEDQLTAVYGLLLKAGKVADPAEARAWIAKTMFGPETEGRE
jgi:hypothetical protein